MQRESQAHSLFWGRRSENKEEEKKAPHPQTSSLARAATRGAFFFLTRTVPEIEVSNYRQIFVFVSVDSCFWGRRSGGGRQQWRWDERCLVLKGSEELGYGGGVSRHALGELCTLVCPGALWCSRRRGLRSGETVASLCTVFGVDESCGCCLLCVSCWAPGPL